MKFHLARRKKGWYSVHVSKHLHTRFSEGDTTCARPSGNPQLLNAKGKT
nr:MAG TPA: hypothetical protein [Caudoviricetes sp.]